MTERVRRAVRVVTAPLGRGGQPVDVLVPDLPGFETDPGPPTSKFTASVTPRAIWSRQYGYDPSSHRYRTDYVAPDGWDVTLQAGGPLKPNDVESFEFRAEGPSLSEPIVTETDRRYQAMSRAMLHLPAASLQADRRHFRLQLSVTVRFADGRTESARRSVTLRDYLIAVIGDSVASGEGNPWVVGTPGHAGRSQCADAAPAFLGQGAGIPIHMSNRPDWMEPQAHRDITSGHAVAVRRFEAISGTNHFRPVTLLSYATSGARIGRGLLRAQHDWQGTGQVNELRRDLDSSGRELDALLVSIGANDVGFVPVLSGLTTEFSIGGWVTLGKPWAEVWLEAEGRLAGLPGDLDRLAAAVDAAGVRPRAVFMPEYPNYLFDSSSGEAAAGCGLFNTANVLRVSETEAQEIEDFGNRLNAVLRDKATAYGWNFIEGIARGFRRHGYCVARDSWWVAAGDSCRQQGDFMGTAHPNRRGHEYIADHIYPALHRRLPLIRDHRTEPTPAPPAPRDRDQGPVDSRDHRTR